VRTPKDRLMHLLKLAAEGDGARARLVHELCEALIDWPREYPSAARLPFETLLEKTIREADSKTRAAVADTVARHPDAPIILLNQLFFAASVEMRDHIVARNDGGAGRATGPADFDENALVEAARQSDGAFPAHFARGLGISDEIAEEVLYDGSGQSLAIVCKGAHARRATFSALAVLAIPPGLVEGSYERLASYDAVPLGAAEHMLAYWRSQEWLKRGGSRNAAE